MEFENQNEADRIKELEERLEKREAHIEKLCYDIIRARSRVITNDVEIDRLNGIIKGLREQMAYICYKHNIEQIDIVEFSKFREENDIKMIFTGKNYEDLTEEEKQCPTMDFSFLVTKKEEIENDPNA